MLSINFNEIDTLINESDSFVLSLLVTFLGTALGFFGAFYISKLTERQQKKKEELKSINLIKSRIRYLTQLIESSLSVIDKQVIIIEELAINIINAPKEMQKTKFFADNNLIRLQKMDTKEFFDAYHIIITENEESNKDYNIMYNTIDYLYLAMNQVIESYKIYQETFIKDQLYIKEKVEYLSILMIKCIKEFEKNDDNYKDSPNYKFIVKHHDIYNELILKEEPLCVYENKYLLPFGNELRNSYSKENFFNDFFLHLSQSMIKFDDIERVSLLYAKSLNETAIHIRSSSEKLMTINKKIISYYTSQTVCV